MGTRVARCPSDLSDRPLRVDIGAAIPGAQTDALQRARDAARLASSQVSKKIVVNCSRSTPGLAAHVVEDCSAGFTRGPERRAEQNDVATSEPNMRDRSGRRCRPATNRRWRRRPSQAVDELTRILHEGRRIVAFVSRRQAQTGIVEGEHLKAVADEAVDDCGSQVSRTPRNRLNRTSASRRPHTIGDPAIV